MLFTIARTLLITVTLSIGFSAQSHGTGQAKHGGVTATVNDLNFELVPTPSGALLYIDDHGKPLTPSGFTGRITVLNGTAKTEADWVVAGDRLEAKGVKLSPGSKVVASLSNPAKKAMTVRFTVK
jgi:hypothetical protein